MWKETKFRVDLRREERQRPEKPAPIMRRGVNNGASSLVSKLAVEERGEVGEEVDGAAPAWL